MKAKKQALSLLFILMSVIVYGQQVSNYKCLYELDMLRDTVLNNYTRKEVYVLQIGDGLSKGFTYQNFYNDSLNNANPDLYKTLYSRYLKETMFSKLSTSEMTLRMAEGPFSDGLFPSVLYRDYNNNECVVTDNIKQSSGKLNVVYEDDLSPQDWNIEQDTEVVLGYNCQKATCDYRGRSFVAWFTTEIPISEGPYKFHGLPGLITKLYDTQKHYQFELIGFMEVQEPIEYKIAKGLKKMDRLDFFNHKYGSKSPVLNLSEGVKPRYDFIERDYEKREE